MNTVRIVRLPGGGVTRVDVPPGGISLADFVRTHSLSGDIMHNSRSFQQNQYSSITVQPGDRVTATQSVKGA